MRNRTIAIVLALVINVPLSSAAAAPKSPKLTKCDGKHRRTANPYGSILPTVDPQTGTSAPASETPTNERQRSGVEVFPAEPPVSPKPARSGETAEPVVPPISSAQPQRSYRSC